MAKARAFLESLQEARVNLQGKFSSSLKRNGEAITNRMSAVMLELSTLDFVAENKRNVLKAKLATLEEEYLKIVAQVRNDRPDIAGLIVPEACTVEEVQERLLDKNVALIEYFLGDQNSFMFFITSREFRLFRLPPKGEIEKSLRIYLKIISSSPGEEIDLDPASERLSRELLGPAADKLSDSLEYLIIVPDSILYYLPFETLKLRTKSHSKASYLVERFKVSYAASSSSLLFLSEKREESKPRMGLLAFGSPNYRLRNYGVVNNSFNIKEMWDHLYQSKGFDFSPLPYSKKEIMAIARYFKKRDKSIFLGDSAKEETLKNAFLKDYQIVHFACHCFLDEEFPHRSALVLSFDKNREDDGFLHVHEIYNLMLNADLVVLSACQTGKGSLEKGEGLLGLPRIFFYSGARSVLSSLWEINDQSTSVFMAEFYRFLADRNNLSEALRLAKIRMMKSKYSHPFYWSAFVLNGNFKSVLNLH
jgi:CHAT domain-containing protein